MNYPMREGKNGPIYHLATGLYVRRSHRGAWEMVVKRGKEHRRRAFGKDEEGLRRAVQAAELLAAKLKLILKKEGPVSRTFGVVAQEWYEGGFHRWTPATRERYAGMCPWSRSTGSGSSSGWWSFVNTGRPRRWN